MRIDRVLLSFMIETIGGYLLGAGNFLAARRVTGWGLEHGAGGPELWRLRGRILLRAAAAFGPRRADLALGVLEEAEAAFSQAQSLRPRDPDIWRERGLVWHNIAWASGAREGTPPAPAALEQAISAYDRVLEAQPRRADVFHERAMARVALRAGKGDPEALACLEPALADLDRSLELRPHAPESVFHRAEVAADLARVCERSGDRSREIALRRRSVADCVRVLELRPRWHPALLRQAIESAALARRGDTPLEHTDAAIACASVVIEAHNRDPQALLVRADARVAAAALLCARGDARGHLVWHQALTDLESAIDAAGVRAREEVLAARANARAEWAAGLELSAPPPEVVQAWMEAIADYDHAVDDDPADADRLIGRGRAAMRLAERGPADQQAGWSRRAQDDFRQALVLRPGDLLALAGLALARLAPGADAVAVGQSLREAEAAVAQGPEHGEARQARRRARLAAARQAQGEERLRLALAAADDARWALVQQAEDARARYDLAVALFLAERPAEAHQALSQALREAPGLRWVAAADPAWQSVAAEEGFLRLLREA